MPSKKDLFLELAQPDNTGLSRKVFPNEFKKKYAPLTYTNGNPWARSLKTYIIYIHKEKNKTQYIQLRGLKKHSYNQNIKSSIKKTIKSKPCVVLNTTHCIECDHKDGFKAFDIKPKNQTEDLFQPMHKSVNSAKREHCKKCKKTKKRFDAKKLGYKKSVYKGNLRYEGTCKGCYWHDPFLFNQSI
ncbi:MAG: hypothetical protein OXC37_05130 [Bdellovibrionaceae bacterium]|nr:hypothetical protein [Pseudobdellovibrionaceae bacterium]